MTRYKILRLLAIAGALLGTTAKAQEKPTPKPGLTVFASNEQNGLKKNYTGLTLKPDLTYQTGKYKLGYYGSFYQEKNVPGENTDWITLANKMQFEDENWILEAGKSNTRQYAGCLHTPTTCSFDNRGIAKGTGRTFTGTILTHKDTGLSLGQVASDAHMAPKHWDNTLLGWTKGLNQEWAIQLQVSGTPKKLSTVGGTIKGHPTDTITVVAEGFYKGKETTGLLTANHKLTDRLNLFAGTQMTWPDHGKATGLATAGASCTLGKGFTLVVAGQQTLGEKKETTAVIALKYAGDFR